MSPSEPSAGLGSAIRTIAPVAQDPWEPNKARVSPPACFPAPFEHTAAPRLPYPQWFGDTEADGKPTYVMHAVRDVLAHSVPIKRAGWSGRIQAASRLAGARSSP